MKRITALVAAGALVAGCATTDGTGQPRSAMDRAMGQCVASVAVGALLGAVVGNNNGNGNAGRGAAYGAAAGGAVCAVLLAMASQEDKRRIEQAQILAASTGQSQTTEYVGEDGVRRRIQTTAGPEQTMAVPVALAAADSATTTQASAGATATAQPRVCRPINTAITVQDKGSTQLSQLVCRTDAGAWEPLRT